MALVYIVYSLSKTIYSEIILIHAKLNNMTLQVRARKQKHFYAHCEVVFRIINRKLFALSSLVILNQFVYTKPKLFRS